MDANTTGSNNVALGYEALGANTTASNNTAVGIRLDIFSNTTGTSETLAVGNLQALCKILPQYGIIRQLH